MYINLHKFASTGSMQKQSLELFYKKGVLKPRLNSHYEAWSYKKKKHKKVKAYGKSF